MSRDSWRCLRCCRWWIASIDLRLESGDRVAEWLDCPWPGCLAESMYQPTPDGWEACGPVRREEVAG